MASEFAVPMMGAMGAVILAGINEDMAMPAYMMLGSIAMLIALLLAAGAVTLPLNSIQALAFGGSRPQNGDPAKPDQYSPRSFDPKDKYNPWSDS